MRKIFRWFLYLIIFFVGSTLLAVVLLKWIPVYYTPTMFSKYFEQKAEDGTAHIYHHWVPMDKIAPSLSRAVISSEDNLFVTHHGFDFRQIYEAQKDAIFGKRVRGASTISQQVAKNVFLWQGKNFIRKGLEAYFTVLIEFIWGKERIMEVYLNSIEMGKGIYGASAVAKRNFDCKAIELSRSECALIAASLPNPVRFDSANPSPYMRKRQRTILSVMKALPKRYFVK